ncbi:hypothetical protein Prudu_017183 [Prunus dulcis]|uniref:Uncharacterized protein n=1 Tax=Prunus dulcis TaxID=3755 RepID=A0A4Y1RMU8_PRUDU|nr:hypothetical protein Prudu_017183 [Prunus dulcis]
MATLEFEVLLTTYALPVQFDLLLDILPLLLEKAPFPAKLKCPFHSSHAPDVYSISMLPEEGNSLRCASMCMDAQSSCQNGIDSQANMADSHPPCIIEIDLEKGCIQAPESEEEAIESLKREGLLTRVFRRQASLKVGGKLMHLLFNHGTSRDNQCLRNFMKHQTTGGEDANALPHLIPEKSSSLGTLVLIYLTLRVRQSADVTSPHFR